MKSTLFCLLLLPALCFGQTLPQEGLWKGYPVQDKAGKEIGYKRQDFIKITKTSILLLQFQELMSMKTGEVVIKPVIDTLEIVPIKGKSKTQLLHKGNYLNLESTGEETFQISYPKFVLTFKKISNLKESTIPLKVYEAFIVGNTLAEANPKTKEIQGTLSKTYLNNGMVKYQSMDSNSNWESPFKLIEFEGFIFLKGITSAPIILNGLDKPLLKGLEVDYRFAPKEISLGQLDKLIKKKKPTVQKPFEIELVKQSNAECITNLPPTLLDLEIRVAKGITEQQITTVQVQHAYECDWMLFHEEDFDGLAKVSIRELLIIDSSLCPIFEIPCGYYAERTSKQAPWYIYLHEDRIETDSSYILKKAFQWNNTYRVINEVKGTDLTHYQDYHLDTRLLKKTWSYLKGKEVGITCFYDKKGKLIKEVKN